MVEHWIWATSVDARHADEHCCRTLHPRYRLLGKLAEGGPASSFTTGNRPSNRRGEPPELGDFRKIRGPQPPDSNSFPLDFAVESINFSPEQEILWIITCNPRRDGYLDTLCEPRFTDPQADTCGVAA
jgi:hypothetical protein